MLSPRLALVVALSSSFAYGLKEAFTESLLLKPLPDGKLSAHFEFTTTLYNAAPRSPETLGEEDQAQHYTLFPLPLGQLLRSQAITELHLSLNSGKWDYDNWGNPKSSGVGSGAELWVWMADGSKQTANQRWKDLANGLAGLFCASLGSLDETRTTRPRSVFNPEGDLPFINSTSNYHLLHATFPSESVCTENLTPFLKLLPCKGRSGLATLLNPHRLFDSHWHGIGADVIWKEDVGVVVTLTFGAVMDPVRISGGKRDWSFTSLFGRPVPAGCPVATDSSVKVLVGSDAPYSLTPQPSTVSGPIARYNTSHLIEPLDLSMTWPLETKFKSTVTPSQPVSVRRVITGGSQSRGGFEFEFVNRQNVTQEIVVVETAPWFINYFLNTRKVTIDGVRRDDVITSTSYTLPTGHHPTLLETTLNLPPLSTTQITTSFQKSFIAYTEHPPDAERGWDLPPAVITLTNTNQRIYTRNLLIDLPTPDFSMPYNVIIMTSTVIALFFGSIFNLLTRKFVWVRTGETDLAK